MKKGIRRTVLMIMSTFMIFGTAAYAQTDITNVGNYTNEDNISLYVKGLSSEDPVEEVSCQIGMDADQTIAYEAPGEVSTASRTLVLLDNSISISEENREKIKNFLSEYAYVKPNNEQIALVEFSETLNIVSQYVTEKSAFNEVINSIEYNDQDTHLIDALYEVLKQDYLGGDDCYKQIIVIADGVDNQEIGYTRSELDEIIKEKNIPIHALGCQNKTNNEQLEDMFAIARSSQGSCFLLDELDDITTVANSIASEANVGRFIITPQTELMDGSTKEALITVKTGSEEVKIRQTVVMPFSQAVQDATDEADVETAEEATDVSDTEPVVEPTEEKEVLIAGLTQRQWIVIIVFVVLVFVVLLVLLIIMILKNNRRENEFITLPEGIEPEMNSGTQKEIAEKKAAWEGLQSVEDTGERTEYLWNNTTQEQGIHTAGAALGGQYHTLIMTDMDRPDKIFQIPFRGEAVVGRSATNADLILDQTYRNVSNKHCLIFMQNGKVYIRDLGSSFGTMVNGVQILDAVEIQSGCIVTLGVQTLMRIEFR